LQSKSTALIYTDMDRSTLANIPDGSPLMWVHLLAVYLIAGLVMWVSVGAG